MLTPQEIQERTETLEKAVFGGYSVSSVEELLAPLTEDYAALYKENAVLKSKMKVLVDKLEEYRAKEESINRTLLTAQKTADEMVTDAERKSARMLSDYEKKLRVRNEDLKLELTAEQERVSRAKAEALAFITDVERRVRESLEGLKSLKELDLTEPEPPEDTGPLEQQPQTGAAEPAVPLDEEDAARQIEESLRTMFEEAARAE